MFTVLLARYTKLVSFDWMETAFLQCKMKFFLRGGNAQVWGSSSKENTLRKETCKYDIPILFFTNWRRRYTEIFYRLFFLFLCFFSCVFHCNRITHIVMFERMTPFYFRHQIQCSMHENYFSWGQ